MSQDPPKHRILYCRCAFAQVVPGEVKDAVLRKLCDADVSFESVSDLCEMSARKDPRLKELLAGEGEIKIAACFPRAVKWLFHSAGVPFPDGETSGQNGDAPNQPKVKVLNMREQSAEEIADELLGPGPAQD